MRLLMMPAQTLTEPPVLTRFLRAEGLVFPFLRPSCRVRKWKRTRRMFLYFLPASVPGHSHFLLSMMMSVVLVKKVAGFSSQSSQIATRCSSASAVRMGFSRGRLAFFCFLICVIFITKGS